jgi:hypothetical protein
MPGWLMASGLVAALHSGMVAGSKKRGYPVQYRELLGRSELLPIRFSQLGRLHGSHYRRQP